MKYVALLRGIGPLNPNMRNENLRSVFEDLGFDNVQTVISSGNVVFESRARNVSAMEARIEAAWPERLGFRSTTIIRTESQIADLVARSPFEGHAESPTTSLEVTFLKHEPEGELEIPFSDDSGAFTIVAFEDRTICTVVHQDQTRTPNFMRTIEKRFGKEITTRTWKTVHRLLRKLRPI